MPDQGADARGAGATPQRGIRRLRGYVRPVVETLLAGLLAGYVIGVLAGQVLPAPTGTALDETREAHLFMGAVYRNDVDTQVALMSDRDPLGRALQVKVNSEGLQGASFRSMTFLGGETVGRLSIQMYALEARTDDGREGLVPYALTMGSGRVVRIV